LIQDAPFRDFKETQISLLLVNNDNDTLGNTVARGLGESHIFKITSKAQNIDDAQKLVADGKYSIGVFIQKHSTVNLQKKIGQSINKTLSKFGMQKLGIDSLVATPSILIYIDPATKSTFKNMVFAYLQKYVSHIQAQMVMSSFMKNMGSQMVFDNSFLDDNKFINIEEKYASTPETSMLTSNSVQHNVPAWTMFAMFFIILPLAGNMIKERDEGSLKRVRLIPGAFLPALSGKLVLYTIVCMLQFIIMILIGIFIMPMLGLPSLQIGFNYAAIIFTALSAALASVGCGILVGTLFGTHQQATTFGAVIVVIMAALGGIWIPVVVMPKAMATISHFSPLAWGLNAFNNVFLRNAGIKDVLPENCKLLLLFALSLISANFYEKYRLESKS
jgi:ABC-2 type transport system permease protein